MGPYKWKIPVARYRDPPPPILEHLFKSQPANELPIFDVIPAPVELDRLQKAWETLLDGFNQMRALTPVSPLPLP